MTHTKAQGAVAALVIAAFAAPAMAQNPNPWNPQTAQNAPIYLDTQPMATLVAPAPVQGHYAPADLDDRLAASVNRMVPGAPTTAPAATATQTAPAMPVQPYAGIPATGYGYGYMPTVPGYPVATGAYPMPGYGAYAPYGLGGYPATGAYGAPYYGGWNTSDDYSQGTNSWPFGSFSPFGFW